MVQQWVGAMGQAGVRMWPAWRASIGVAGWVHAHVLCEALQPCLHTPCGPSYIPLVLSTLRAHPAHPHACSTQSSLPPLNWTMTPPTKNNCATSPEKWLGNCHRVASPHPLMKVHSHPLSPHLVAARRPPRTPPCPAPLHAAPHAQGGAAGRPLCAPPLNTPHVGA